MSRVNRSGDLTIWEVPEIDGVCRSLERYGDDDLSNEYWDLIDEATRPGVLRPLRQEPIAIKLHELRCMDLWIKEALESGARLYETPNLLEMYRSSIKQITEITGIFADDVHRI